MNKITSVILTIGLLAGVAIIFWGGAGGTDGPVENSEIIDGVQYVTVNAGGGYFPQVSNAKAGIPTKLIVKTNGVYDCSSALSIPSVGFQKILSPSGDTEIDIGTPIAGKPLQGTCSMGMYSFRVNFN